MPPRTPVRALAVGTLAALLLGGCALPESYNQPGANGEVGFVDVRYAHLAEPRDGDPWREGDDVPLYLWVYNDNEPGGEAARLVGAESPVAASVDIVAPEGEDAPQAVTVPPDGFRELERDRVHLVLRDVEQTIRGGDFVPVTFEFDPVGSLELNVQAQPPTYGESPEEILPEETEEVVPEEPREDMAPPPAFG
ncbi:hypothetical protein CUT44_03640 [Streptomyces carminius]|uniref:Copper chaperone PCu(A)C n=1 Tax=Streptomyces carminius TaxID=2665496 RepID=A0A2M8M5X6_9ACTN|nr:copper chaperone PCu(A)C [Streptomyces carminius]PJE99611.1 hypothetical protein CUT44_03640 [Streptomyces carminius]